MVGTVYQEEDNKEVIENEDKRGDKKEQIKSIKENDSEIEGLPRVQNKNNRNPATKLAAKKKIEKQDKSLEKIMMGKYTKQIKAVPINAVAGKSEAYNFGIGCATSDVKSSGNSNSKNSKNIAHGQANAQNYGIGCAKAGAQVGANVNDPNFWKNAKKGRAVTGIANRMSANNSPATEAEGNGEDYYDYGPGTFTNYDYYGRQAEATSMGKFL